jgi:hypothetical protein
MHHELIELGKRSVVDQLVDALARRALSAGVLFFYRGRPGWGLREFALARKLVVLFVVRSHRRRALHDQPPPPYHLTASRVQVISSWSY